MDTSPARNFMNLLGNTSETAGLAISSVTLVYLIRLTSTIACDVIEQLPKMISQKEYTFSMGSQDFVNWSHLGYMVLFMGLGVSVRLFGTRIRRESTISRVESWFGYDKKKEA